MRGKEGGDICFGKCVRFNNMQLVLVVITFPKDICHFFLHGFKPLLKPAPLGREAFGFVRRHITYLKFEVDIWYLIFIIYNQCVMSL